METRITATELARNLSDILNRARYLGERFVVERNGEEVVTIESAIPRPRPIKEIAAMLARVPPPDVRYADDLEAALAELRQPMSPPREWPT